MSTGTAGEPAGDADRYAVIGFPVAHSRSPLIHRLFAEQTGQRIVYERLEVDAAHFESAVAGFSAAGGRGLNVTVPHKEAAFRLASQHGADARRAGAVNTLSFDGDTLRGDNTDGAGFLRDLTSNHGFAVGRRRVLVLGAGGAARGILPPLLDGSPSELVLANRTAARALDVRAQLAAEDRIEVAGFDELRGRGAFDLVVNATSAGVKGESAAFPAEIVGSGTFCYDLAYADADTPFVAWARSRGAMRAVDGLGMLVEQAAESFFIWRGVRPDTAPVIRSL